MQLNMALRNKLVTQMKSVQNATHVYLRVYSGPPPADIESAPTGVRLWAVEITTKFSVADGVAVLTGLPIAANPIDVGVAGYARISDQTETKWADFSVGLTGSFQECILSTLDMALGVSARLLELNFIQPES